ncbi:MAG TPA: EF-hand domain-containing protein [Rhodanobacteraceae bacterium]|jgi:Ca2+-binding EF-hand superfamily protein|nr:EF-hand domain-containing protein [Rhodanobacteraceae bacterium]
MKTICQNIVKLPLVGLLAALSLTACAATGGGRSQAAAEKAQERFAAADTNHDGYLSRDEAAQGTPRLSAHFDEIDSDHDGLLSKQEIIAFIQQRRGSR